MTRWVGVLLGVAGGLGLLACDRPSPSPPGERPNVLLFTLDTTRADHLGCYGDAEAHTPNLDGLAARGALFTHAIAQAAVTPVSHASIPSPTACASCTATRRTDWPRARSRWPRCCATRATGPEPS